MASESVGGSKDRVLVGLRAMTLPRVDEGKGRDTIPVNQDLRLKLTGLPCRNIHLKFFGPLSGYAESQIYALARQRSGRFAFLEGRRVMG